MLRKMLEKIAEFQYRHAIPFILVVLFLTIIAALGVPNMSLETDMQKQMPQDLPIFQLNDRITEKFGGQDTIMILFMLDEDLDSQNVPSDIRHPDILNYLIDFEEELSAESSIQDVSSAAMFLRNAPLDSLESATAYLDNIPQADMFFSDDLKKTVVFVSVDVGTSDRKITEVVNLINSKIEGLSTPAGVEVMVSGNPPMMVKIAELLWEDAIFTVLLASAVIFILLILLERSLSKAVLIMVPLLFGVTWTVGVMGWIGLKLSFATAGLGAMILGLGVEYGVFMFTRYEEEREKGSSALDSLKVAVPGVGLAVLGSGMTTIFGFLALTLSVMPMLQNLGLSLALGIFFSLLAALLIEPIALIIKEEIDHRWAHYIMIRQTNRKRG